MAQAPAAAYASPDAPFAGGLAGLLYRRRDGVVSLGGPARRFDSPWVAQQVRRAEMLSFKVSAQDGVDVLALEGRLDAVTAPELRPTIDTLVQQGPNRRVVCDLRSLETIDSSGVGAIISLFKRLRLKGGDLRIARLRGQPKEIFRLLRLDRAFELYETLEEATAGR